MLSTAGVRPVYALHVSSDPFADLARGVGDFAGALTGLLDANKRPAAGSPADKEADGERSRASGARTLPAT
jgi:hypothetical protein